MAIPDRKDQRRAGDRFAPPVLGNDNGAKRSVRQPDLFQLGRKPDLAAEGLNLLPHRVDNGPQTIGSDVRLCKAGDLLRRAAGDKLSQNPVDVGVRDARSQFSVRKRSRAAFAECNIALRIERVSVPVRLHVQHALFDRFSSLNYERRVSVFGKLPRGKQSARSEPHDNDTPVLRLASEGEFLFRLRSDRLGIQSFIAQQTPGKARIQGRFRMNHQADIPLFSCVDRLTHDPQPKRFFRRDSPFFPTQRKERLI